jgi:hypothetical protein
MYLSNQTIIDHSQFVLQRLVPQNLFLAVIFKYAETSTRRIRSAELHDLSVVRSTAQTCAEEAGGQSSQCTTRC